MTENVPASERVEVDAEQRFAIVPEWVLDADVPDRAIRVYAILARYGNGSGRREVSRSTIARRARCSTDSVDRALTALVDVGALAMERTTKPSGDWGANRYTLLAGGVAAAVRLPGREGAARGGRVAAARVAAGERHDREIPTERTSTETRDSLSLVPSGAGLAPLGWVVPTIALEGGYLDDALNLCEHLATTLRARGVLVPAPRARSKAWVIPMEAMLRLDARTPDQARRVIDWLAGGRDRTSAFWQGNVLSPDKLRMRWDQMGQQYRSSNRVIDRNAGVLDDGTDLGDLLARRSS